MRCVANRLGCVVIGVGLSLGASVSSAATVWIRAVRLNGTAIEPTLSLDVAPGNIVETRITISGWGLAIGTVKTFQVTLDNESLVNPPWPGTCGSIYPLNFDRRVLRPTGAFININTFGRGVCADGGADAGASCVASPVPCTGGTCVDGICLGGTAQGSLCATADNQCDSTACISDPDFLFTGFSNPICAVDTSDVNYRAGCTLFLDNGPRDPSHCVGGSADGDPCDGDDDCPDGACEEVEFYVGTAVLQVGDDAGGTFLYDILPNPDSFVVGPNGEDIVETRTPLALNVAGDCVVGGCCFGLGDCEEVSDLECEAAGGLFGGNLVRCGDDTGFCSCPHIVSAVPENCAIDARYPHPQGGSPGLDRIGFESVELTLSPDTVMSYVEPDSFQMSFVGGGVFNRPNVTTVTPLGGTTVRLDFDKPFPVQRWTCLGMACAGAGQKDVCWGHLPGDVCHDGTSTAADVLCIVDGLNGVEPLEWYHCDVDDSGACNAADVLAVIDLLNGAGDFDSWNNVSTSGGRCPTAP